MRIEKIAILDEVVARIKDSDYCFIINHGGVTVDQFAKLRKDLRAQDSRLLVVKNSFLGKVAKEKELSMVILMLTDVLLEGTQILYIGDDETIHQAFNATPKENTVFLPRVMSRKKQVIPILSALWG